MGSKLIIHGFAIFNDLQSLQSRPADGQRPMTAAHGATAARRVSLTINTNKPHREMFDVLNDVFRGFLGGF